MDGKHTRAAKSGSPRWNADRQRRFAEHLRSHALGRSGFPCLRQRRWGDCRLHRHGTMGIERAEIAKRCEDAVE